MKRCSTSLIIREAEIKTINTMRYHFTPVRRVIIKKSTNWRGCGEEGTFLHSWWECKLIQPLRRTLWRFLKKLGIKLPYDPATPLLGISSAYTAGDTGSIPGSGRSSGEGNGNSLQCSCLKHPMDRGAKCVNHSVVSQPVAVQAPLSVGCSRQEYCSGLPFPPSGDLPDLGIETGSPALQSDSLLSEPPGKPYHPLGKFIWLSFVVKPAMSLLPDRYGTLMGSAIQFGSSPSWLCVNSQIHSPHGLFQSTTVLEPIENSFLDEW